MRILRLDFNPYDIFGKMHTNALLGIISWYDAGNPYSSA